MKSKALLFLALLCTIVQGVWAMDYNVKNDDELRAAIQNNGANITVTTDISLSNSTLSIAEGTTVTIDLGGYTLDRRLKWRGEGGGQVITVRSGATLNLSNGTLKGGWGGAGGALVNEGGTVTLTDVTITNNVADDRGGGICNREGGTLTMTGGAVTNNISYDKTDPAGGGGLFNAENATMTLTNVTITGNEAKLWSGGGICNYGTLKLDGCTIQNNTARFTGGGIWNIYRNNFKMQGANIITDNIAGGVTSNLFLKARCLITLTGSIAGSQIGVTLERVPETFTKGYDTYHQGVDPYTFFTCDRPEFNIIYYTNSYEEVMVKNAVLPEGTVPYIERSWDSDNKKVVTTMQVLNTAQYTKLTNSEDEVELGTEDSEQHEYYVVSDEEVKIPTIYINGPNVHIILCDNAKLHVENEIDVWEGHTVYFHAQSSAPFMGKLTAAGIGGNMSSNTGGNIEIHGGYFDLQGTYNCSAIGGKYEKGGNITIFDGQINATGGDCAAGIGGGYGCENYGNITIYGGTIEANGEAAIGGGQGCLNGDLTIWGGAITARGKYESAGIGGSQYGGDYGAGTININGGYIRAYGDQYGAGIGGGDGKRGGTLNVNGGHVEAYGGTDAAGIGGGEGGNGGIVNITGGYVYAEGGWEYGAGIGGGQDGEGANVTITGGVVIATAGENAPAAIGAGHGSDSHNSLTFADDLGVFISTQLNRSVKENRVSDCRNNRYVRVTQCAHGGATTSIVDGEKHAISGCNWCYTGEEAHTFGSYGECAVCHLIALANDADNSSVIAHWDGSTDKAVTLRGRTLWKDGYWNTLCLPFNVELEGSVLEGATLKELHEAAFAGSTLTLNFNGATVIKAGVPYLIKWESGNPLTSTDLVFEGVTISKDTDDAVCEIDDTKSVTFHGIYKKMTFSDTDNTVLFLGAENQLHYPLSGASVGAQRAYFQLTGFTASEVANSILYFGDNETTMITTTNFTDSDDAWYTLNGMKLANAPTAKGIYIHNGKKVAIK